MQLSASKQHWSRWTFFFAFWTLIGLSFASQLYLSTAKAGWRITWGEAVVSSLSDWYVFALLAIPSVRLARRFSFERLNWGRAALLHLAASLVFSLAYVILRAWVGQIQAWLSGSPIAFAQAFQPLLVKTFQYNLWVYWVIIAVTHAFDYYRKFHERALRASELEKRLAQARLQALQSQINPHFLFNTLHTISALMHKDVEAADRMVSKLSQLLRRALDSSGSHEVPLREELDFLQQYLEIEKTRFGERLQIETAIAPETLGASVPNLVLQPLVENAIRHGVERHARPGRITLRAHTAGDHLELQVEDNGAGIDPAHTREGIGLSNTRSRLEQLYGSRQNFALQNLPGGGLLARVVIPFRSAEQNSGYGQDPNTHRG